MLGWGLLWYKGFRGEMRLRMCVNFSEMFEKEGNDGGDGD